MKHCKCCDKHFLSLERGHMATVCDPCFNNTTHGRIIELGEFCNCLPKVSFSRLSKLLNLTPSELLHLFVTAKNRFRDNLNTDHNVLVSAESIQKIIEYINNHEQEIRKHISQFNVLDTINDLDLHTHNSNIHKPNNSSKLVSELQEKIKIDHHNSTYHISEVHSTHHVSGSKEATISGRMQVHHNKKERNYSGR